jgi:hypothetical protein
MKQHEKRFIIEYKGYDNKWSHSGNDGHTGFFETKEAANAALTPESTDDGFKYRVRQK